MAPGAEKTTKEKKRVVTHKHIHKEKKDIILWNAHGQPHTYHIFNLCAFSQFTQ